MDVTQLISGGVAMGGVLAAFLAYFKFKPGQRQTSDLTVAQGSLNIAQGTIDLVTTELEEQFKRMSAEQNEQRERHATELAEERRQVAAFRSELDAAMHEIRDLRAELRGAWAETEAAKRRCAELESKYGHLT